MNVIYSSSDEYSELAGVSILSLLENNKNIDEIEIYIVDKNISECNKRNLESIALQYRRNLHFLENVNIEAISETKINVGRWHISTFSRLFILEVLPPNIKKIIYIDCDTIIRDSLKNLWNTDMQDAWVMGVDDCRGFRYRKDIGLHEDSIYINNGIIVIDIEAWVKNNVEDMFIKFIQENNGDITYVDQGVLNGVLGVQNRMKLLPVRYNAQTIYYDLGYRGLTACRNPVWAYSKEEFNSGISAPTIVHFTTFFLSGTRPWFEKDNHPYRNEFLQYRELTPWGKEPLWKDPTSKSKKLMIKILKILPRSIMFFVIRVGHSLIYPILRGIKRK